MLNGVDVAAHDGVVDWRRVKEAGNSFAFVRAAYGTRADSYLKQNLLGAREAGLATGVYHFIRATRDFQQQIDLMVELIDSVGTGAGDLPPVLDVEDNPAFDGPWNPTWNDAYLTALTQWIWAVRNKTGAHPILYTRAGFWQELGNPTVFSDCPLWVASYRVGPPRLPVSWDRYTFWQYTEKGRVDGIAGLVDLNYFDGDADALRSLLLR